MMKETSDDPIVTFLYTLMRDHVTPGVVAKLTKDHERFGHKTAAFTNIHLARYAKEIRERLRNAEKEKVENGPESDSEKRPGDKAP